MPVASSGDYEDRDNESLMDKIKKKQKQIESNMTSWWSPPEGRVQVRIMPSWRGPGGEWYQEILTHYSVGPGNRSVACLKTYGQECPVCDALTVLCDSTKAAEQKLASDMMPRAIYAVNAGYPNAPDGIVKPWRMGERFFLDILSLYTDGEYGDFSHPRKGYDVIFTRKGTGLKTRYSSVKPAKPKPIIIEDWKSKLKNLSTFVKPYTRKEIRAFLAGDDDAD